METIDKDFFDKPRDFNLKDEIYRYLFFWKWFVLAIVVSVVIVYFYLRKSPNVYNTEAVIQIVDPSSGIELPSASFVFNRSSINLENESNIIKSYSIVESVVNKLNLNYSFYLKGTIKTAQLFKFPLGFEYKTLIGGDQFGSYTISFQDEKMNVLTNKGETLVFNSYNTDAHEALPFDIIHTVESRGLVNNKTYIVNVAPVKSTVISLKNRFEISQIGKQSHLLSISLKGENPKLSKVIIDTLMSVFKNDGIRDRQMVSKSTIDFINSRFESLISQLDSVETIKEKFKKKNNIIDVAENASADLSSYINSDNSLYKITTTLSLAKSMSEDLNENENKTLPINMIEGEALNGLIREYNSIVEKISNLELTAGENNPSLKHHKDKLSVSKQNLNSSLGNYIQDLELSKNIAINRKNEFNSKIYKSSSLEKQFGEIARQQKIKQALYLFLLQKREEAAINLAITEPSVKIIDYALTEFGPISPRPKRAYIVAILVGLILPLGVLFIIFTLDNKVHSKADIDKLKLGVPVVAEVPIIKKGGEILFRNPNDRNVLAESFRILASNVGYILPNSNDDKGKVIYTTSAIKGEGKTFVSINLSLALSSIGKRVLLIGADLRNPQLHSHIGKDKNTNGLSNYLHDINFDWKTALINGFKSHANHDIMLSGSIPPNPAQLLTNGRFEELLNEAKQIYDYIIIDTAPCILVTDTMLISELADATVFVTRSNHTDKKLLEFSKNLADTDKIKNMAYVVNAVGVKKGYGYGYKYGYGYGYGYGYNYGYGYGYGSDK